MSFVCFDDICSADTLVSGNTYWGLYRRISRSAENIRDCVDIVSDIPGHEVLGSHSDTCCHDAHNSRVLHYKGLGVPGLTLHKEMVSVQQRRSVLAKDMNDAYLLTQSEKTELKKEIERIDAELGRYRKGIVGETFFSKCVSTIPGITSYWSLEVPSYDVRQTGDKLGDIDCIIDDGSTLYFVDVKNYQSSDVYTISQGNVTCTHSHYGYVTSQFSVGTHCDRSVRMFVQSLMENRTFDVESREIKPIVVFVPNDMCGSSADMSYPKILKGSTWASDIQMCLMDTFLSHLRTIVKNQDRSPGVIRCIKDKVTTVCLSEYADAEIPDDKEKLFTIEDRDMFSTTDDV